jgi:hypothetical protein
MKMLRCLIAIVLVYGLTGVAKADDFQMIVIDPFTGPYTINPITTTSVTFSFTECEEPGQIPAGADYDGCFTGQNETGSILTSLQMIVPLIAGQTAGCAPSGTGLDIFSVTSCGFSPDGSEYILDFSGGSIQLNETFTIAEDGVDADVYPEVAATFDAPEPSSIWLLSSGILTICLVFGSRRWRAVCASRFWSLCS